MKLKTFQLITALVNENGDVADFHNILNGWKNYFCQQLYVHGVNSVGLTEINTAEPLLPEPTLVEIVIQQFKWYKLPDIDQFWQNSSKPEVKHYLLISTNL